MNWLTQSNNVRRVWFKERFSKKKKKFERRLQIFLKLSFRELRSQSIPWREKNVLKIMTVLYTYFYNISLNLRRPTFFNICNLPFLRSHNIGKIRVKVGIKTNYFFLIYELLHQQNLKFSIIFCHWYVANEETNKAVPMIFFFSSIFWIIYF